MDGFPGIKQLPSSGATRRGFPTWSDWRWRSLSGGDTRKGEKCGLQIDRDLNASINLSQAVSSTVTAYGVDNADVATVKQEVNAFSANE